MESDEGDEHGRCGFECNVIKATLRNVVGKWNVHLSGR